MKVLVSIILASLAVLASAQEDCPSDACASTDVALKEATNTNDPTAHYYIGGMFNVHDATDDPYTCGAIRESGILNLEAFFWAINKYSTRQYPTGRISVGGFGMDSCSRDERAVENAFSFETCRTYYTNVSPRNTMAMVGPETSSQALQVAKLLNDMKRTVVSPGARSTMLTDDDMYHFFLRTIPSIKSEVNAITKFLENRGVKYVQVLYAGTYGKEYMEQFRMAPPNGTCITQSMEVGSSAANVPTTLLRSPTEVVLLFADAVDSKRILTAVNQNNEAKNLFYFIGTSMWGTNSTVIAGTDIKALTFTINTASYPNMNDVDEFYTRFSQWKPDQGSSTTNENINTHNPWFNEYWQNKFSCRLDLGNCNVASQSLQGRVNQTDPLVPFTLMAVDAIVRGAAAAITSQCSDGSLCSELLNRRDSRGSSIYNSTVGVTWTTNQRYFKDYTDVDTYFEKYIVHLVSNGTYSVAYNYDAASSNPFTLVQSVTLRSSCYSNPCTQCNETAAVTTAAPVTSSTAVPMYNASQCLTLVKNMYKDDLLIEWRDDILLQYFQSNQEFTGIWRNDQPRTDAEYMTRFELGHDWIIALGVLAGLGIVCVLVFEIYILYKLMGTKIGKQWRTMWLGQLLLFGIFLAYLVCIAYLWIPTRVTCGITRFGVGVSYAMCFAVLLVKLMVLLTSKTSADTLLPGDLDSPNYLRGIYQFLMYLFIVGVQVVIAIQWLIMVPPEAVKVSNNNGQEVWICNHYTWNLATEDSWHNMQVFVRTNFENHLISLCYVMFLVFLTVVIAMKAHGIITNHRESVFIGISAGFSIPVFIAWGLVGGLNKNHIYAEEFGDACFAFGLFIVATIILFAMFLPKVRQLVNMGVEGIYLEDDRDTYYAGSVVMSPPSYKSRPSSMVYVNSNGYSEPVVIGDPNTMHLKHPGSNYSAPVYVKRPESTIGTGSGKVLRMTGDLTGKHPRDNRKSTSEIGYGYAGSGYGTYRKARSESGGTIRRAHSTQDLGAL